MAENEMKAGRELDAKVAERAMGWTRHPEKMHPTDNRTIGGVLYCPPGCPYDAGSANVVLHYSTDRSAAWQVVEHMKGRGYDGQVHVSPAMNCYARFENAAGKYGEAYGETHMLAVCRATLKAIE
jgi:hypothetical protein